MYYKRKEEYRFSMPREYYAYLAFKDRLKAMGIAYVEEGRNTEATIAITSRGTFDVDNTCDILKITKG